MLAEAEGVAMNRQLCFCGFVLLAAMLLNGQDVPPMPSENLGNAVANRSVPFVDLLREAEAGGPPVAVPAAARPCRRRAGEARL